jgi:hypothetical protein
MPAHSVDPTPFAVRATARWIFDPTHPAALGLYFYSDYGPGEEVLFGSKSDAISMLRSLLDDIEALPTRASTKRRGWNDAARAHRGIAPGPDAR